ncbi:MAG: hypothetical protein RIA08_19310 [Roseovarius sp.]|uniref:hypothetical protein n=1 Tax=Roseovarius sp. TaxID=1486281 RepID=UPI0032F02725
MIYSRDCTGANACPTRRPPKGQHMQIVPVLKGCLAAYAVGVLFNWGGQLLSDAQRSARRLDPWNDLWFSAIFGAILALPVTVLVLLLWFFLARRSSTVTYRDALASGAAGTGLVFWAVGNPLPWLLVGLALGAVFGAVFWLTAFGRRRQVTLTLR